ncbi:ABC transporter substrate-binding protein [Humitalea sp. 24SJ18S-53]|uniref:ABC transporter substrate-binding protein n=1 Tax=Humitalea sp. 24SJ18S-53 TaxID=3422307 RepID=UPI003D663DAE
MIRPTRRALLAALPALHFATPRAQAASLPTEIPRGTRLTIGDPVIQKALEFSGAVRELPFTPRFANISGGPRTLEAFRARALDLGSVADIPPIHATWTGLDIRIIAVRFRQDWRAHPVYRIATAPRSGIATLADLCGKRIAYSPGQAQGVLVLRLLRDQGLGRRDVSLVELPSTGDVYPNALASNLVDAAPVSGTNLFRYIENFSRDGARALDHGLRDDPAFLYAPRAVLDDPARAAAAASYVQAWARARRWVEANPAQWIDRYHVRDQGLTLADGQAIHAGEGVADIPADWTDAIARQQDTIDLMAEEMGQPRFDAATIFDRRFEPLAAAAVAVRG